MQKEGHMDLPAYREENLAKNLEENDKTFVGEPCPIQREREKFEKLFEK